jgi:diaminopimelate epimerase
VTIDSENVEYPLLGRRYFKAHGLGNDYLVFREGSDWAAEPPAIRGVCERRTGVGSDGIVVLLGREEQSAAPFRLRMFNPDGSEFERSGNGLRILAAFLDERNWVGSDPFSVQVGGGEVVMRIDERRAHGTVDVSVEMGRTRHGAAAIGLDAGALDGDGRLDLGVAGLVTVHPVSVGNPHVVVFDERLDDDRLGAVGPPVSTHPAIARGTNVQLARVLSDTTVEARIWERGVGVTAASGTSACAVAAAAVHTGRVPPGEIEVRMPGGSLSVWVDAELRVTLRGPVQIVCEGRLDAGYLRGLA